MAFNGNNSEKDPITGYLTPRQSNSGAMVFGNESKIRFLKLFEETGNLTEACDGVGVKYDTMRSHAEVDEAFARDLRITLKRMEHKLEGTMYRKALEPSGDMARFGWLRAHNPSKWNPKTEIRLDAKKDEVSSLLEILKSEGKLIDVDSPLTSDSPES